MSKLLISGKVWFAYPLTLPLNLALLPTTQQYFMVLPIMAMALRQELGVDVPLLGWL